MKALLLFGFIAFLSTQNAWGLGANMAENNNDESYMGSDTTHLCIGGTKCGGTYQQSAKKMVPGGLGFVSKVEIYMNDNVGDKHNGAVTIAYGKNAANFYEAKIVKTYTENDIVRYSEWGLIDIKKEGSKITFYPNDEISFIEIYSVPQFNGSRSDEVEVLEAKFYN